MVTLQINGQSHTIDAPDDMPLLWALRDIVGLTGTKFGCGIAQCGACTVHLDGKAVRSCLLPVGSIGNRAITTIEAIGETPNGAKIQKAWLDIEVVQCGYCQSGQIMSATALAQSHPQSGRFRHRCGHGGQYLPLRHLCAHPPGDQERRQDRLSEALCPVLPIRPNADLSRRNFLKVGTAAGGGLMLGFHVGGAFAQEKKAAAEAAAPAKYVLNPNAFIAITPDGKVSFQIPQEEMGQGVYTSLSQLAGGRTGCRSRPGDAACRRRPATRFMASPRSRRPGHRRLDLDPRLSIPRCARWAPAPAPCWSRRRRSNGRSIPPRLRTESGQVIDDAHGGRRLAYGVLAPAAAKLPAPQEADAQGRQGSQADRQIGEAAGHAGQGQRQGAVRHRCAHAGPQDRDLDGFAGGGRQGRGCRDQAQR